ncbi:hypothetical protein C367_04199 [Cryptococcus neoformans Ze90-1]|nr:hypothetical protein C367_04199 [Cryptococcus neoformans var. grubii Ze90-1]
MSLLPLNITLSFSQPSFHPVLHLTFNVPSISDLKDVSNSVFERKKLCEPVTHLEIALPDALFVDPDELSGKWPLHSSSESAMHQASEGNWKVSGWGLTPPSVNIERPSFGNAALHHTLHVLVRPQAFFEESDAKGGVGVEVPLHARYLAPRDEGRRTLLFPGEDESEIRSGWTCATELTQSHRVPTVHPLPVSLTLPTGRHAHQPVIEVITPLVIWLGWAWIAWKLWKLKSRVSERESKAKVL